MFSGVPESFKSKYLYIFFESIYFIGADLATLECSCGIFPRDLYFKPHLLLPAPFQGFFLLLFLRLWLFFFRNICTFWDVGWSCFKNNTWREKKKVTRIEHWLKWPFCHQKLTKGSWPRFLWYVLGKTFTNLRTANNDFSYLESISYNLLRTGGTWTMKFCVM